MKRAALAFLFVASAAHAQVRLPAGADKMFPDRPLIKTTVPLDVKVLLPVHWDFENATLQGFTPVDNAFKRQPTYGNNVSTKRALDVALSTWRPRNRAAIRI
jgi:hypothetical protein